MEKIELATKLVKFSVVGATGVLVNSVTLYVLYGVLNVPLMIASVVAVETAIVSNFFWNNLWTFERHTLSLPRFFKFNLVSLGGLVITTAVLYVLVQFAGLYFLLANVVGISLATLWNFGVNLIWTWGTR